MSKTLDTQSPDDWLQFLLQCADAADDLSRHYFGKAHLKVESKANETPVTEADLAIEKEIRRIAADVYPDLPIYAEEFGQCPVDAPLKFIIDPIDGTQNFVRGIPFVGSLLAIEKDGYIVAGVISCAPIDDRWWASRGNGAFYKKAYDTEATRCRVSTIDELAQSQIFHGSLFGNEATGSDSEKLIRLLSQTKRQRGFGDFIAPMMVAQGCGEFAVDFNLQPWDMASIKIIIEEAGGRFTDINGQDSIYNHSFLVSNGRLHDTVLASLK